MVLEEYLTECHRLHLALAFVDGAFPDELLAATHVSTLRYQREFGDPPHADRCLAVGADFFARMYLRSEVV